MQRRRKVVKIHIPNEISRRGNSITRRSAPQPPTSTEFHSLNSGPPTHVRRGGHRARRRNYPQRTEAISNEKNAHSIVNKDQAHLLKDIMFVGFYTLNTAYEREASKLRASLQNLNLNHDIVGVPDLGDWQSNTRFKARFMQNMLKKHTTKDLVYVDVDAIIHSIPIMFKDYIKGQSKECDIGIRYQNFRWKQNECLSGTIFMANNSKTMTICQEWEKINIKEQDNRKNLEQWNLGTVIDNLRDSLNLKIQTLPAEYTFIFDTMKKMYPEITPVIEHFQASRKNKK